MPELSRITAQPTEIEVNGERFFLSPLTLGDMGEFSQWAADRLIEKTEQRIALLEKHGICPETKKTEMLQAAFDLIDSGQADSKAMISPAGIIKMGWISLRKRHPEITEEKAAQIVTMNGVTHFQKKLDRVSGFDDEGDSPNPQAPATVGATINPSVDISSQNST